jgi:hypothetical protein
MLIEVTKNEETGKYEVETNVTPAASKMNIFDEVTAFYICDQEFGEDYNYTSYYYLAVNEDGSIVNSIDDVGNAKYLIPFGHGGSQDTVYVNGSGTFPYNYFNLNDNSGEIASSNSGNDFTVTNGKITLDSYEFFIEEKKLHLNQIMVSQGS